MLIHRPIHWDEVGFIGLLVAIVAVEVALVVALFR